MTCDRPTELKRKWGWVVAVATNIVYILMYGYIYSYGLLMIELIHEFNGDLGTAGYIGTVAFSLSCVCSIFVTPVALRVGYRPVAVVGLLTCSLSSLLSSFVHRLSLMFLTYSVLMGLGLNGLLVAGINITLSYFPTKHSSTAVAIASAGTSLGVLLINPLVFILISKWGWRTTMRIMSGVLVVIGLPCTLTYSPVEKNSTTTTRREEISYDCEISPHISDNKRAKSFREQSPILQDNNDSSQLDPDVTGPLMRNDLNGVNTCNNLSTQRKVQQENAWLKVLSYPDVWILVVGLMSAYTGLTFLYFNLVNFTVAENLSKESATWIMSTMGISELIGKIVIGLAADRLPIPKIFMIMTANSIAAALMLTSSFISTQTFMFCLSAALGFFVTAPINSLPHSIGNQMYSLNYSVQIWAVLTIAAGLGGVFGAVFGSTVDRTGSYDIALYGNVGIFLGSALFLALVPTYQWFFSRERFIVFDNVRKYTSARKLKLDFEPNKSENKDCNDDQFEIVEMVTTI